MHRYIIPFALLLAACAHKAAQPTELVAVGPAFSADSAYTFCAAQCAYGPRTMNTPAHDSCAQYILDKFASYGLKTQRQTAELRGWDGTTLHAANLIASYRPDAHDRIMLCAHYDTRPWADNDPDSLQWRTPICGANDGASGVAVMLEIARLLARDTLAVGVDFVCFDAEDWGTPQFAPDGDDPDSWALGAQYWAKHPHTPGYTASCGILLDMVGGRDARFYREGMSCQYASSVVDRVWQAAAAAGYQSAFPDAAGGMITDDHIPVNEHTAIPCIDIIPYYPDCPQSSFGPTWHTTADNIENISRETLKAVGQTLVQVLWERGL